MIVYRQTDIDVPFFWESDRQPPQRWHDAGEGPVQYASSTPDAAWAEFLRHAGIDDPADLDGVNRVMWAIEIPGSGETAAPGEAATPALPMAVMPGTPSGWRVDDGLVPGPARDELTIVVFGRPREAVAWIAAVGRPAADIIPRVRYLR